MALTNAFKKAVQTGNIQLVKITMKNSLLVDPTFKDFDEMEDYVKKYGLDILENYDGEHFINDKTFWNDDYMNSQLVELVSNFSQERIEHLKAIIRQRYSVVKTDSSQHGRPKQTNDNANNTTSQKEYSTKFIKEPTLKEKLVDGANKFINFMRHK